MDIEDGAPGDATDPTARRLRGERVVHQPRLLGGEPYDFTQRQRLSPDQLSALEGTLTQASRRMGRALSQYLGAEVAAHALAAAEMPFEDWVSAVPESAALIVFSYRHEAERGVWCVPAPVAAALLAVMTGASAVPEPQSGRFTDLESAWLLRVARESLGAVSEILGGAEATMEPVEVAASPSNLDLNLENDRVIAAAIELTIGSVREPTSLALRAALMRETAEAARVSRRNAAVAADGATRESLRARAELVPLSLRVQLPPTRMPLSTVVRLRPGDVVRFDVHVTDPLVVLVGEVRKLTGWVGTHRGRVAVQVETVDAEHPDLLDDDSGG